MKGTEEADQSPRPTMRVSGRWILIAIALAAPTPGPGARYGSPGDKPPT